MTCCASGRIETGCVISIGATMPIQFQRRIAAAGLFSIACSCRLDKQALVGSQAQGRSDRFAATVAMCGDRDSSLGRCGGGPNLRIGGEIEYDKYPVIAIAAS
jgi:hypothetical protein